jgi:hypothetical protein
MYITRVLVLNLVLGLFGSAIALGQQRPNVADSSRVQEFPVVMRQNVVSGKTVAGTRIQAKLAVATLVEGVVIPRNAVFSGEVIESSAKTANRPGRLAIRMDTVQWKDSSAPIQLYLTSWFYPTKEEGGQNLQYGPTQPANRTWNGAGAYPDPASKVYKPFPGVESDKGDSVPDTPSSIPSNHRILMRDMQSERNRDGVITIICFRSNIKLDRLTTYVLSSGDLQPPPIR